MSDEKLLKAEEVALLIGISTKTLNTWYAWKKEEPNHELAELLPKYEQAAPRSPRYWKQYDVWKLIEFKNAIPHGRNGILGKVTQKYYKKKEN